MIRRLSSVLALAIVLPGLSRAQQPLASVAEARIAVATGRYAEGIAYLERVPRSDTAWVSAQAELSRAYATLSRYDDAERVARAATAAVGGRAVDRKSTRLNSSH